MIRRPAAALVAALILSNPASLSAQPHDPPQTPAEYRAGAHVGVGIGPTTSWLPARELVTYGVMTRLLVNIGLAPALDFRTGLFADGSGSATSYLSLGVPVSLRLNLGSVYSIALGFSAGLVSDTTELGLSLGPEWSLLSLRLGARRDFEIELAQAVHVHLGSSGSAAPSMTHLQTSLIISYLSLDPPAAR